MTAYKLTEAGGVVRDDDGAWIPADPANTDWKAYQDWLAAGNVPTLAVRSVESDATHDN